VDDEDAALHALIVAAARCPRSGIEVAHCGGRLRVLGEVTEPTIVRLVLESLGMPTEAPRPARARDPTDLLGDPDAQE
jgi:hypothetical protein